MLFEKETVATKKKTRIGKTRTPGCFSCGGTGEGTFLEKRAFWKTMVWLRERGRANVNLPLFGA